MQIVPPELRRQACAAFRGVETSGGEAPCR